MVNSRRRQSKPIRHGELKEMIELPKYKDWLIVCLSVVVLPLTLVFVVLHHKPPSKSVFVVHNQDCLTPLEFSPPKSYQNHFKLLASGGKLSGPLCSIYIFSSNKFTFSFDEPCNWKQKCAIGGAQVAIALVAPPFNREEAIAILLLNKLLN